MKHALLLLAILVMPLPSFADFSEAAVDFHEGRFDAARETLEPLARDGNASAQFLMGRMYFDGLGVSKDLVQARELFEISAGHGNAAAQCALGTIYYRGYGTAKDLPRAAAWWQRAAEQDFAPARSMLAWLYLAGDGVPQDEAKAKSLLEKDERPFPARQIDECGWQEPQNAAEILARRFEEAIGRGDPEAEHQRGLGYYHEENYPDAAIWFRKAAGHGQVDAQFALATMYLEAQGVAHDPVEAMHWLEKAAEQWDLIAMSMLVRMNLEREPSRSCMYGYLVEIARDPKAPPPNDYFGEIMTPAQIAAGAAAAQEFLTRFPRPADAATRNRLEYH